MRSRDLLMPARRRVIFTSVTKSLAGLATPSTSELALVDRHGRPGGKGQPCFGGVVDVLLSGRGCTRRTGPSTRCRADRSSLAATGQRANQRAASRPSADEPGIPLTLAFFGSPG